MVPLPQACFEASVDLEPMLIKCELPASCFMGLNQSGSFSPCPCSLGWRQRKVTGFHT